MLFNELRQAGWRRWMGVLGGTLVMCIGAAVLAIASATQGSVAHSLNGVGAAFGAGILWGTMYIPYRKAFLTGMNPLSFVTFFTFGELGTMGALAISYTGLGPLSRIVERASGEVLADARRLHFGDRRSVPAVRGKVRGDRGIPLLNTNQLWGLLWGVLVFGELHGKGYVAHLEVVGGSLLMMLGVSAIALSSATGEEQTRWREAARRESLGYGVAAEYVEARLDGRQAASGAKPRRSALDWLLVAVATSILLAFARIARVPEFSFRWGPAAVLIGATVFLLFVCGQRLWRTTRFH